MKSNAETKPEVRHHELAELINHYDYEYWVKNKPLTSDVEYDKLMRELVELEKTYPLLKTDRSPTQRIGGGLLTGFNSVKHFEPMLSLDNIFDATTLEKRIKDWAAELGTENVTVVVEPKVDGLSSDLTYTHGVLTRGLTRGTGEVGDDVTENIRTIRSVPLFVKGMANEGIVHVRGEVCMTFEDFKLVNERQVKLGLPPFANPRNAAAGALRSLDPAEVAKRRLTFIPYHVIDEDSEMAVQYQDQLHNLFGKLGFKQLPWFEIATDINEAIDLVLKFEAIRARMPFPVDGAVIKINDRFNWLKFANSTRAVRWGYAYKYAPEQAETTLKSITIQVGRTGALAPVAELEPVELDGSTVSRATLCNENFIKEKDVRIGDTVIIAKAGSIIPEVQCVVKDAQHTKRPRFLMPTKCPVCDSKIVKKTIADGKESAASYCSSQGKCPAMIKGAILHWCAKDNMDIQGVGEKAVDILVDNMGATTIGDLYTFGIGDFVLDGNFGPKEASNIEATIQGSKDRGMESVIAGLGIDRIGNTIARKVARAYPNVVTFLTDTGNWRQHLGAADIRALLEAQASVVQTVAELEKLGVNMASKTYSKDAASGSLSGKTIVFTGTLGMDRNEASRLAESQGAKVTGTVSKKTNYLVVGAEPGSKLAKAKTLGVTILDEEKFLELVNN